MITNFQGKKMPKEKVTCKCLSIIMLDSVIKANKIYYRQTILEEYKYEQEKIKIENLINPQKNGLFGGPYLERGLGKNAPPTFLQIYKCSNLQT